MVKTYRFAAVGVLAVAGAAHAAFYQSNVGIPTPTTTIAFDEFGIPQFTVITNQYSALGVTFVNTAQSPQWSNTWPNIDANNLGNFDFGQMQGGPFSIHFNSPVSAASFAMVTNPGDSTFIAKLGGVQVDISGPISTDTASPNNFYGFTGVVFDEILVDPVGGGGYMVMDNLSYMVPTPGVTALLGAAGVASLRRRR